MICERCGNPREPSDKFCNLCGAPLAPPESGQAFLSPKKGEKNLNGLHGWLILVGIGLCLSPIILLLAIYGNAVALSPSAREYFASQGVALDFTRPHGLVVFQLVREIFLLAASIWLIRLFFTKRRIFPRYYILFLVAALVFSAMDFGVALHASRDLMSSLDEAMPDQEGQLIQTAGSAIVWALYMVKSKRVKVTFVK
jgi:hypothetical protein